MNNTMDLNSVVDKLYDQIKKKQIDIEPITVKLVLKQLPENVLYTLLEVFTNQTETKPLDNKYFFTKIRESDTYRLKQKSFADSFNLSIEEWNRIPSHEKMEMMGFNNAD